MATQYILSTLTNSFIFVKYAPQVMGPKGELLGMPRPLRRIRVAGGANRPNMRGFGEQSADNEGVPMWTPDGVCSPVLEEDVAWLMRDKAFKEFVELGHIRIVETNLNTNAGERRKVINGDMVPRDNMSPLLPNDPRFSLKAIKGEEDSSASNLLPMSEEMRELLSKE